MAVIKPHLKNFFFLSLLLILSSSQMSFAQEIVISLGPNKIPINDYFTISIILRNQPLQRYGDFPEIEGFKKSSRTNTTSRITLGKKIIIEQTITQHYAALAEGRFVLKPFGITVNGKRIAGKGTAITILPMVVEPEVNDPPPVTEPPTLTSPESKPFKSQSFLSLETDKETVYVGEGLYVRLAFYLEDTEQKNLQFHNFDQQYPEFMKQLRQKDAWEEAFEPTTEIKPDTVIIREKRFLKYNLFRKILYPLSSKTLTFQKVSLTMGLRLEPATTASNTPPLDLFTFNSRPKIVNVKPLPPHPLRDIVPVGQFYLKENINRLNFKAGQSFTFSIEIAGVGNMEAILPPVVPLTPGLEVYPPETKITRSLVGGVLEGTKTFRYNILARQPGQYDLGKLFGLVYFNPVTNRYDTLQVKALITVKEGGSRPVTYRPEESDPFYKLIGEEENELLSLNQFNEVKLYTNVVILFLLCISLFLFLKNNK